MRGCGIIIDTSTTVRGESTEQVRADSRCVRHALIFNLPWPAHRVQDVQEYPPAHLIPNGYIPGKISSFPLPSLIKMSKRKLAEPEPVSPQPDTKDQKLARRLRAEMEREEVIVEQLREAAWAHQEAKEAASIAAAEARAEAKRVREEEKKKRNENKIRGSGVWSRYEYVSPEEMRRRIDARFAVTSGTRRGGRFRGEENEEETRRMAEGKRWMEAEKKAEEERVALVEEEGTDDEDGDQEVSVEPDPEQDEDRPGNEAEQQVDHEQVSTPRARGRPRRSATGAGPSYVEPTSDESDPEAQNVQETTSSHQVPQHTYTKKAAREFLAQSEEPTPKRRGRPPGSGKLQRAAAAAAARAEAEAKSTAPPRRARYSIPKGKMSIPPHVMTSGIELSGPDSSYLVVGGILLPPSKPANPSDSEFPSVDAASPEAEVGDTPSSVAGGDEGEGEVEEEIVVAMEDGVTPGRRGEKRKRNSAGDVSCFERPWTKLIKRVLRQERRRNGRSSPPDSPLPLFISLLSRHCRKVNPHCPTGARSRYVAS